MYFLRFIPPCSYSSAKAMPKAAPCQNDVEKLLLFHKWLWSFICKDSIYYLNSKKKTKIFCLFLKLYYLWVKIRHI